VYCFCDSLSVTAVNKIVPNPSAKLKGLPWNTINADHLHDPFADRNDQAFQLVLSVLQRWIQAINKPTTEPQLAGQRFAAQALGYIKSIAAPAHRKTQENLPLRFLPFDDSPQHKILHVSEPTYRNTTISSTLAIKRSQHLGKSSAPSPARISALRIRAYGRSFNYINNFWVRL